MNATGPTIKLPFDGEMSRASGTKKFRETILFVHHFGGNRRTSYRHRRFVNELGFDAVSFTLNYNHINPLIGLPVTGDLNFGARFLWTEQIEAMLNAIAGPKIIYCFSMPSNSAFEAVARRHAEDIRGVVCDGGPFLQLPITVWNLYEHEYKVESKVLRTALSALGLLLLGPTANLRLREKLASIPDRFPVLSIRGSNDPLVPVSAIDDFLKRVPQLKLEILSIEGGHHLDGIKNYSDLYKPPVREYLNKIGMGI